MCEVSELRNAERRLVIEMRNKRRYVSDWYKDDGIVEVAPGVFKNAEQRMYDEMIEKYNIKEHQINSWYISRKRESEKVYMSDHAMNRLKQRNGWNRTTSLRMVQRIYDEGIAPEDVKGYLAKWVKNKNSEINPGDCLRLYGDVLYVFHRNTLITAYQAPKRGFNYLTKLA